MCLTRPPLAAFLFGCVVGSFTAGACAQQTLDATGHFSLAWEDTGNHNGVLEPGEAASIRLSLEISPAINTVIEYIDQQGIHRTGTLRGLASGFLDINSSNTLGGAISNQHIDPVWDLIGVLPNLVGTNQQNLQYGQFPQSNEQINTTNPLVDVFTFVWTPIDYSGRVATFRTAAATAGSLPLTSVYILTGPTGRTVAGALNANGAVQIPIVPAPAGLALLGVGATAITARRRAPGGSACTRRG